MARKDGLGLEECGRRERYAFFEELAAEWEDGCGDRHCAYPVRPAGNVPVPDRQGDRLWTACAASLPVRRTGGAAVVRTAPGRRWRTTAAEKGLSFVTDSTNADVASYARNRIRARGGAGPAGRSTPPRRSTPGRLVESAPAGPGVPGHVQAEAALPAGPESGKRAVAEGCCGKHTACLVSRGGCHGTCGRQGVHAGSAVLLAECCRG